MNSSDPRTLHAESIVIDAVCPLVMDDPSFIDWYREGGVTALAPTVGGWEGAGPTVIGIVGFPAMVSESKAPTLDQFIAHIDAIVQRVGINHVGLGIDYYWGQSGVATDAAALASYNESVRAGRWSSAYPAPPHHYPSGIQIPRTLPNLTARLIERGYSHSDVRKILGENWLRVIRDVWG